MSPPTMRWGLAVAVGLSTVAFAAPKTAFVVSISPEAPERAQAVGAAARKALQRQLGQEAIDASEIFGALESPFEVNSISMILRAQTATGPAQQVARFDRPPPTSWPRALVADWASAHEHCQLEMGTLSAAPIKGSLADPSNQVVIDEEVALAAEAALDCQGRLQRALWTSWLTHQGVQRVVMLAFLTTDLLHGSGERVKIHATRYEVPGGLGVKLRQVVWSDTPLDEEAADAVRGLMTTSADLQAFTFPLGEPLPQAPGLGLLATPPPPKMKLQPVPGCEQLPKLTFDPKSAAAARWFLPRWPSSRKPALRCRVIAFARGSDVPVHDVRLECGDTTVRTTVAASMENARDTVSLKLAKRLRDRVCLSATP